MAQSFNHPQTPPLVLVVDDDVRAGRILAKMLYEDGFDVELAADGAAAIGRLSRAPIPSILVTDLRMAHADGGAVARCARSYRPNMPVFVITGYPDHVSRMNEGLSPPAVVLAKPVDYPSLSSEIHRAAEAIDSGAGASALTAPEG